MILRMRQVLETLRELSPTIYSKKYYVEIRINDVIFTIRELESLDLMMVKYGNFSGIFDSIIINQVENIREIWFYYSTKHIMTLLVTY